MSLAKKPSHCCQSLNGFLLLLNNNDASAGCRRLLSGLCLSRIRGWLLLLLFSGMVASVDAHELWLEPVDFTVSPSAQILADIRNGENFKGINLPFIPTQIDKFTITGAAGEVNVQGRLGDIPAVRQNPDEHGLSIIAYQSQKQTLRYPKFEKFESFAKKEGIEFILLQHAESNLPRSHIVEVFFRYAKSLVWVADNGIGNTVAAGAGNTFSDRVLGMPLELVVEDNPYLQSDSALTVTLFWQGEFLSNAQISVFEKSSGLLTRVRTDGNGQISLPRESGIYLLNAVHAVRPNEKLVLDTGAVWQTLWASSTFEIP